MDRKAIVFIAFKLLEILPEELRFMTVPSSLYFHHFDPAQGTTSDGVIITPSVLSCDFANPAKEIARCRAANASWLHMDIMDGHFVPNITFGPPILKKWTAAEPDAFYDAHLMISQPMKYAEAFVKAGAGLINIHIETTKNPQEDLRAIAEMGALTGLTIKPKTPLENIIPFLEFVDMVLVMTVEPGFGGQAMIPQTLNKVRELNLLRSRKKLRFRLQVDGGINLQTISMAVAAGADTLVAGAAVFENGTVKTNLKMLRQAVYEAQRSQSGE